MPDSNYTQCFSIFGEAMSLDCAGLSNPIALADEFTCYPTAQAPVDWSLHLVHQLDTNTPVAINPKSHSVTPDGFRMNAKMLTSEWRFDAEPFADAPIAVTASLKEFGRPMDDAYRWLHRQFTSRADMLGQIIHEHVLTPRMLLHPDRALLHAASILRTGADRPICIGGTGGSGKTSLMLEACCRHGWSFVADDIAVMHVDGRLYPNFSYPKIYGYNLDAFPELKPQLHHDSFFGSRLHWFAHRLRGPSKVRRRVDPRQLFNLPARAALEAPAHYVILNRGDGSDFSLRALDRERAAEASIQVLHTELSTFLAHLRWSSFNRLLLGAPINDITTRFHEVWRKRLESALSNTECYQLNFPASATHAEFLRECWPIIDSLS